MFILPKERWDESRRLTRYCFRDNSGDFTRWYYDRRASNVYALADDYDGIIAQAVDSRVKVNVRGREVASSMISHVATDPGCRSKGIMRGLLTDVLCELNKDGVALAVLYPSAYSFYERYGFAACGNAARVAIAPDRLEARPLADRLCWDDYQDINKLADCYAAAHVNVSGSVTRGVVGMLDRVDDLAQDGAAVVSLYRDGIITGYWFRRDEPGVMYIDEAAFRDASARRDFLSYIAQNASTVNEARLRLPAFDPLLGMLPDRYATITLEPWGMFRAVDLPGLANGLPAGDGDVTLDVAEGPNPVNAERWRFASDGGRLCISRVREGGAAAAASLGVGAVAAWLVGSADGTALMESGHPLAPETARAMDALLPARRVFLWEQY
ncbi:MAG: GNAT family N-acetyltransferase [Oscillospiraceae bacterium]|jgi:predicted acetyltransferase|nr:GNAT family N-acetyltransferase [Oscillospiraceae bacterium]